MKFIYYSDYLRNRILKDSQLFISKTSKSYLIGPKITNNFDEKSFYKRLISSSLYVKKMYKKFSNRKALKLSNSYYETLNENEVIEVFKDGSTVSHLIIKVPGVGNE